MPGGAGRATPAANGGCCPLRKRIRSGEPDSARVSSLSGRSSGRMSAARHRARRRARTGARAGRRAPGWRDAARRRRGARPGRRARRSLRRSRPPRRAAKLVRLSAHVASLRWRSSTACPARTATATPATRAPRLSSSPPACPPLRHEWPEPGDGSAPAQPGEALARRPITSGNATGAWSPPAPGAPGRMFAVARTIRSGSSTPRILRASGASHRAPDCAHKGSEQFSRRRSMRTSRRARRNGRPAGSDEAAAASRARTPRAPPSARRRRS